MKREIPSEYKGMWLFVIFDLPVMEHRQRKAYTTFRRRLLAEGFSMLQYSVYARYTTSRENCQTYANRIKQIIPTEGQVRLIMITDKQFGDMEVFYGRTKKKAEDPPDQLLLF
ncbi:MAG: CRISPR-associated endonuclease Cas2 [Brevinematales bacterium]|nr:CRISPR-associated endonuclease Cas2 [Brevinematales bacterium]